MTDLNELLSATGAVTIPLENPFTFEPVLGPDGLPATVTAWGPDSAVMRDVEKQITTEMTDTAIRARGRQPKYDQEKYNRRRFLARIDSWDNLVLNGQPFLYDAANKARLYDDPDLGRIREMFINATTDNEAFLAKKAT